MLIEKITSMSIVIIATAILIGLASLKYKSIDYVKKNINVAEGSLSLSTGIDSNCMQHNTISYQGNLGISCIYKKNCVNGTSGKLTLVNEKGVILNSVDYPKTIAYDESLELCTECNPQQSVYYLNAEYEIICDGDCNAPLVKLTMTFIPLDYVEGDKAGGLQADVSGTGDRTETAGTSKLKPVILSRVIKPEQVYSSCQDAYSKGEYLSGAYHIDYDGFAHHCPIKLYCRMSSMGTKALLINAPKESYMDIPVSPPPILPQTLGRLDDETMTWIFKNSKDPLRRVSVDVIKTQQGNLTIALASPVTEKGSSFTLAQVCAPGNTTFLDSKFISGENWEFRAVNEDASIGFSSKMISEEKSYGFHCMNCNTASVCSLGSQSCCQKNLGGSVWLND